jgi:amidophosphoribosyltransferase
VCREITADALVYQDIDALKRAISDVNPALQNFEASCFDGVYVTGDVTQAYLDRLEYARHNPKKAVAEDAVRSQLNLNLAPSE